MAAGGGGARRGLLKRKPNFTLQEIDILMSEVLKYEQLLFGAAASTVNAYEKQKIWWRITNKINAAGRNQRDIGEVKNRWRGLRRRANDKITRHRQERQGPAARPSALRPGNGNGNGNGSGPGPPELGPGPAPGWGTRGAAGIDPPVLSVEVVAPHGGKIPPAAEPPLHPPPPPPSPTTPSPPCGPAAAPPPTPSPPPRTLSSAAAPPGSREGRVPYTVGSPHAAAACSQPECGGGGSQSITSPLPANTPSPSFSKLPPTKASKSSRAREEAGGGTEPDPRKRKPPLAVGGPPYKRTCSGDGLKSKNPGCQVLPPPGKTKPTPPGCPASSSLLNGATRVKRLAPPDCRAPPAAAVDPRGSPLHGPGVPPLPPPRCISEDEVKKRKNAATYCRPVKPKPVPPLPGPPPPPPGSAPPDSGGSIRRKKPGTPLGFEEKRSALKSKAH
ncbi:ataxin-7-like protein 2 [Numenius arquata]|uniref:ataxin-7-like protein 2 n=1 Tax=Numenius arquata TaxID=31919 RepID=UPI003D30BAA8